MPHIFRKLLMKGTKFLYTLLQAEVYKKCNKRPKWWESQFQEFRDSQLGSPKKNDIWVQPLWLVIENIIRGKVVASPSSNHDESYKSVYTCGLSVHQKCSNYTLTNLLFDLCRSIWIIDPFVIHPSPYPGARTCSSYFEVLWVREHTPTPSFFTIPILDSHLSLSRSVRVCHYTWHESFLCWFIT